MSTTADPLAAGASPPPGAATRAAMSSPRAMRGAYGGLPPQRDSMRYFGLAVVIALHAAVLVALLMYQPAREMLGISKPLMVEFITPPAPPKPEPPKEEPKPKEVKIVKHVPQPKPLPDPPIIASTAPTPSPMVVAPPPPVPPPPPEPVAAAPAPPAPPAQPKVITGVEYVRKVDPVYPAISKRMNEQGKVGLRLTIDTQGRPESVVVSRSSGSARLDEAARKAYLECLFKPYMENGIPQKAVASVTVNFSLSE